LRTQWRRYRKRLKRCQKQFSENAVHDVRVETRRLLSTVELLGAFVPEAEVKKARRTLKRQFDTFNRLRDTQVQLIYVGRMAGAFAGARPFRDWLRKREACFTHEVRKNIRRIKTKRLGRRLAAFEREISRQRKQIPRAGAWGVALCAVNAAFVRVVQLCRRANAGDTRTIHRTRIAFKRFRYMVEALPPSLPTVTEERRQAMRGYQSMMGDIQDVEILLAALDKFVRRGKIGVGPARQLKKELAHRRGLLIEIYLNAAGRLRRFWPSSELRPAKT
jgi:CHAD domain-containing protein